MKRRNFILALGATSAAGAAAVGSGAFNTVEASRDVTVEVAGDASAYLVIEPGDDDNPGDEDNGEYAEIGGDGQFFLNFTEDNDQIAGDGDGFNPEAVTGIEDVFIVQNQGNNPVDLSLDYEMDKDTESASVILQPVDDSLLILLPTDQPVDEPVELDPGHEQGFSVIGAVSESIDDAPKDISRDNIIFTAEEV